MKGIKNNKMDITKSIITNVLQSVYQPFWFSVLFAVFFMFFYLMAYMNQQPVEGAVNAFRVWRKTFFSNLKFRKMFILVFVTMLVLFKTLLNRNMWANPLTNVMGGWWIWKTDSKGKVSLTTECIENFIMLMPFMISLLWTFEEKFCGKELSFKKILWNSIKIPFLFSITIEFLQLFLRLGTFQVADLCYNTTGGTLAGIIYYLCAKLKRLNHRN